MTAKDEALQQALVALELSQPARCGQSDEMYEHERKERHAAITAIREALAEQPAQQHEQEQEQEQEQDDVIRDEQEAPFEAWWEKHGQFLRAGGGQYEKTFAWHAWCESAKPAQQQEQEWIEAACVRIKAANDAAADGDYMLDSNDCIKVIRGEWKWPLMNDHPIAPQPAQQEPVAIVEVVAPHLESIVVKHILDAPFPKVGDFLYTEPPQRKPLTDDAKAVIDAARAAMDDSVEAYDSAGSIKISSHLAASLSLCLDEYDRAIEAAHGIKERV